MDVRGRQGVVKGRTLVATLIAVAALTAAGVQSAQAAFPGANGKIAFARQPPLDPGTDPYGTSAYITTMNPDGSAVVRVSERPAWDPAWSPSGDRLAVMLNWRVTTSVAVMGADGSVDEIVPYMVVYYGNGPAWSPTGERIAFTGFRIDGTDHGLYTVAADGTDLQHVADLPGADSFGFSPGSYGSTSWSPDGALIAFAAVPGDLYTVAPDGSGLRNVTATPDVVEGEPDFSPDGRSIAYTRGGNIWIIGATGGKPKRLTAGPASDSGPAFSPDGTKIAFSRNGDIWVITLKSKRKRNLTPDATQNDYQPNWQAVH